MQCGTCADEQEVSGLTSLAEVNTVVYAYWSRHDHTPEQFELVQASKGGAFVGAEVSYVDGDSEGGTG